MTPTATLPAGMTMPIELEALLRQEAKRRAGMMPYRADAPIDPNGFTAESLAALFGGVPPRAMDRATAFHNDLMGSYRSGQPVPGQSDALANADALLAQYGGAPQMQTLPFSGSPPPITPISTQIPGDARMQLLGTTMPHANMAQAPGYNPVPAANEDYTTVTRPYWDSVGSRKGGVLPTGNIAVRVPTSGAGAILDLLERAQVNDGRLPPGAAPGLDVMRTVSNRTVPEGVEQVRVGGSMVGVSDPEKYRNYIADLRANEQAGRNILAQRGMMRGEAKNLRDMGVNPKLAALLTVLNDPNGADGGMRGMALADSVLGEGAGLKLAEMRDKRTQHSASLEAAKEIARTQAGGKATGGAGEKAADPVREHIVKSARETHRQLLRQSKGDDFAAAASLYNSLQGQIGASAANEVVKEITGHDISANEKRREELRKRRNPGLFKRGFDAVSEAAVGDGYQDISDNLHGYREAWKTLWGG